MRDLDFYTLADGRRGFGLLFDLPATDKWGRYVPRKMWKGPPDAPCYTHPLARLYRKELVDFVASRAPGLPWIRRGYTFWSIFTSGDPHDSDHFISGMMDDAVKSGLTVDDRNNGALHVGRVLTAHGFGHGHPDAAWVVAEEDGPGAWPEVLFR